MSFPEPGPCNRCQAMGVACVDRGCPGFWRKPKERSVSMDLLPSYFYLAGSLCFVIGTLIVIAEGW